MNETREIGRVRSVSLERGKELLIATVTFEFKGNSVQSLGPLYADVGDVIGIMGAFGASKWEDLPGKLCWTERNSEGRIWRLEPLGPVEGEPYQIYRREDA